MSWGHRTCQEHIAYLRAQIAARDKQIVALLDRVLVASGSHPIIPPPVVQPDEFDLFAEVDERGTQRADRPEPVGEDDVLSDMDDREPVR